MILVTGATGLVGVRLVNRLVLDGASVRVLVRRNCDDLPWDSSISRRIECVVGSVTDLNQVEDAAVGVRAIVHLAGIGSPATIPEQVGEMLHVNVTGTANVLASAARAQVQRFILASSASVYGEIARSPVKETMQTVPISAYGVSKLACEDLCRIYEMQFGISTTAIRFFNIYGSGAQRANSMPSAISAFIHAIERGESIVLWGRGRQRRDFIYVDDAVESLLSALNGNLDLPSTVNIGSGAAVTMREVVDLIAFQMKERSPIVKEESARVGDVLESVADISRAREYLNFTPRIALHEGIQMMVREMGLD